MPGLDAKHFPYILRNSLVIHSTQMKNKGLRKFIKQSPHVGFWIHLTSKPTKQILSSLFTCNLGFPGGACCKEPACQCRRRKRCGFNPWVGKIAWRRAWQPTLVLLPGESQGQEPGGAMAHRVPKSWTQLITQTWATNQPGSTVDDI